MYRLPILTLLQALFMCCGHRNSKRTEISLLGGTKLYLENFYAFVQLSEFEFMRSRIAA